MNRKIYTVYQVNKYIKALLEEDMILNDIFIEAEISNFKYHSSGHMYFTLKDDYAAINCVMFKSFASQLLFVPENGMKVIVFGRVSLYEKTGQYQIYAEMLEPFGKGSLAISFEQLKQKLEDEGLFSQKHKKEMPSYPKKIAVVTSPTGAAVQDIINIIKRRNKTIEILIIPALVQGENAARDIADKIKLANQISGIDVLIVGRGGGSVEDLWAFNEEIIARSIFASHIPVISAVGHETDFTIADFVSDLRAPTPSAAAELAVPELSEIELSLENNINWLNSIIRSKLSEKKALLMRLMNSRTLKRPLEKLYERQIYVYDQFKKIQKEMDHKLEINKINFFNHINLLESISPINVVKRGFAIISDEDGNVCTSMNHINEKDIINIKFQDGSAKAEILSKREEANG